MPSKWPRATIRESAAPDPYSTQIGPFGDKIRAETYSDTGMPVLRGLNCASGVERFHDDGFVFLPTEKREEFTPFLCEAGDVILVHKGTIGQVGIIPDDARFKEYVMGNSMMRVRCGPKLDRLFLYYWLRSPEAKRYFDGRLSTVGVPQIQRPLTTLREAEIPRPTMGVQRSVAGILGALDDKIELNGRMNRTLRDLADALFKTRFATMRALLPDGLASNMGNVPSGWNVGSLASFIQILSGGTPRRSEPAYWNGSIPWFSVRDAPVDSDLFVLKTEESITPAGVETSAAQVLPIGTVIISARGTVGKLAIVGTPMAMNQSCFGIRGKTWGTAFTYFVMREAIAQLKQHTHGSVFDTITRATFGSVLVACPPEDQVKQFELAIEPILARIKANCHETLTLIALRDALLPKLMSGEVLIQEAADA